DRRPDETCAKKAPLRLPAHAIEHPGVQELPGEKRDEARGDDAWNEAEHRRVGLLILPTVGGRRHLNDEHRERRDRCKREGGEDRTTRCFEPVHLRDDIAENVSEREEEHAAVEYERQ